MPDTAILLCPYNHSQQLEGMTDETSTYPKDPIQEEENYYKKGVKRDRKGGAETPQHTRGIKKCSLDRAEDQSSLMNPIRLNLIVKNTMMTIVHTLKPSSLAHSLLIHCIGLAGPRSHAFWAWPEKRVPTLYISFLLFFFSSYFIQNLNSAIFSILLNYLYFIPFFI